MKSIKSDVFANFTCSNNKKVNIITNKITALSDLSIVEKYIKELNSIDSSNIISFQLSQSKSYLKFLGVSYLLKNTSNIIEIVIKDTYIFINIVLAFQLHIIKVSSKSDIAVT